MCENAYRSVFSSWPHQLVHFIRGAEKGLWLGNEGHHLGDAPILFEVHQRHGEFFETAGDVEPERAGFHRSHSTDDFFECVFEGEGRVDVLNAVEQGEATTTSSDLLELFDHEHLTFEVAQCVFQVALERLVLVALWVAGHDFLPCDVFTGRNLCQDFFLHRSHPRFGFETEQHRDVSFRGVADAIVQQATHDDVRVQLDVRPIVESELVNSVEQFLLFLEQHVLVEGRETIAVLLERLIQHHVLNPAVLDDFLFAPRQAVFVDFEDVLGIVGLDEETDRNDVPTLKFVQSTFDQGLREGKTFHHFVGRFRTLGAQHFDDFHTERFLGITKRSFLPCCWFCAVKRRCNAVRQSGRVKLQQVFDVLATGHGQAAEGAVNFCHVGHEPLAVQFFLSRPVNLRDLSGLTQFLDPTSNRFQRNIRQFLLVEWVVEFTVQTSTVAHEAEQFLGVGGYRGFVGVVSTELLGGEFGGQGARTQETLQNGRVDVFHEERPRFHRHQVLKRRHEQGHTEPGRDHHLGVNNASLTGNARRKEVFETDQVDVAEHDFALGFTHQQAAVHGSVLLEKGFCSLLKLLWTDLFSTHSLGDDQGAT